MITENLSTLKIHKLTQEQYERELAAGRIDENALYLTPDTGADMELITVEDIDTICKIQTSPTLKILSPMGTTEINPTYTGKNTYTVTGTVNNRDSISSLTVITSYPEKKLTRTSYTVSLYVPNTRIIGVNEAITDEEDIATLVGREIIIKNTSVSPAVYGTAIIRQVMPGYAGEAGFQLENAPSLIPEDGYEIQIVNTLDGENITVDNINDDGSWSTDISIASWDTLKITVVAIDNTGKTLAETRYLCFDGTGPLIAFSSAIDSTIKDPIHTNSSTYTLSGTAFSVDGIENMSIETLYADTTKPSFAFTASLYVPNTYIIGFYEAVSEDIISAIAKDTTVWIKDVSEGTYERNIMSIMLPPAAAGECGVQLGYKPSSIPEDGDKIFMFPGSSESIPSVEINDDNTWSTSISLVPNSVTKVSIKIRDNANKTKEYPIYIIYDTPELYFN